MAKAASTNTVRSVGALALGALCVILVVSNVLWLGKVCRCTCILTRSIAVYVPSSTKFPIIATDAFQKKGVMPASMVRVSWFPPLSPPLALMTWMATLPGESRAKSGGAGGQAAGKRASVPRRAACDVWS
eukprot:289660-Rhodomonas_salina.2